MLSLHKAFMLQDIESAQAAVTKAQLRDPSKTCMLIMQSFNYANIEQGLQAISMWDYDKLMVVVKSVVAYLSFQKTTQQQQHNPQQPVKQFIFKRHGVSLCSAEGTQGAPTSSAMWTLFRMAGISMVV
jgi:hypothetical protein